MAARRPLLTAVGLLLFFASYPRAAPMYSDWGVPVNLGPVINSPSTDAGPAIAKDGLSLFFGSDRPGGAGATDIYVSQLTADGSFGPATRVPELSSAASDNRPSVRFDGLEVFLFSNRPGTFGGVDLWSATRATVFDAWSTPVNLG